MAKSIEIRGFRCFEHLALEDLTRVNVLVGPNGCGKTALMEALFLLAGNPSVAAKIGQWRGLGQSIKLPVTGLRHLWEDLFWNLETERGISIAVRGNDKHTRALQIGVSDTLTLPITDEQHGLDIPLRFEWTLGDDKKHVADMRINEGRVEFSLLVPESYDCIMFPAHVTTRQSEAAERLSTLRKAGHLRDVLSAVRRAFPDVEDVSAEHDRGEWLVHVKTKGSDRLAPSVLHSAGLSRFLNVLLGIASAPKGMVLVDEFENGIFHDRMTSAWESLVGFAEQFKTQIFVSTHSLECLRALEPVLEKRPKSFTLLQFTETGKPRAVTGHKFLGAIKNDLEVR